MVEVIVGKRMLGDGKGRNKKEAEQAAARNALERVEGGPTSDRTDLRTGRPETREATPAPVRPARAERPRAEVLVDESPEVVEVGPQTDDDEGGTRKRRRGRRGGRGRRRAGETPEAAAPRATTPAPARIPERGPQRMPERTPERMPERMPERTPSAVVEEPAIESSFEKLAARVRAEAQRETRPVEVEPMPRLYEEDENEEVGRPEGPRDDSHVDPYAWGGSDLRTRPVIASTPPPPVAEEHESEEVLEEDDAEFAEPERPEVEMPEVEAPELPPVASRPAEPAPTSRPVGFGRRRSRR
jgi:ribonuclease E